MCTSALGGFVGNCNFLFSVTDHAQNGFYHFTEWIPVVSSALAVGFLMVPLVMQVSRAYLFICGVVMFIQAAVESLDSSCMREQTSVGRDRLYSIVSFLARRRLRPCYFLIWYCLH